MLTTLPAKNNSRSSGRHSRPRFSRRTEAYIYLLINTVVWGVIFPLVKPALSYTTAFRFMWYRFLLGSILSIPLLCYYWPRVKHIHRKLPMLLAIESIATVALAILYYGLTQTTALETALINSVSPIFMAAGGMLLLKEKEETHEVIGTLIAFGGTVLFIFAPFIGAGFQPTFSLFGNILIVIQALLFSLYYLLAKKYYHDLPKMFVTVMEFFICSVYFFLFSWMELRFSGQQLQQVMWRELWNPAVLYPALYMTIFGSFIGLTTYIKGQDKIEASEASLFTYLGAFVYVPLSVWYLHEQLSLLQVVSVAIIVIGVFLAEKRFPVHRKLNRSSKKPSSRSTRWR